MRPPTRLFALLALLLIAAPAAARDYTLGNLLIGQPWTRATPPSAAAGGGFLTVTNKGTVPDKLISAKSAAAGAVQIHEMKMEGNIMRMRERDGGLEIPPGATVALAPGGFHLMLMGLKEPLRQGATVPMTLVFEKAGSIDIELQVQAIGAAAPGHGHK